jgi:hypothetical protein
MAHHAAPEGVQSDEVIDLTVSPPPEGEFLIVGSGNPNFITDTDRQSYQHLPQLPDLKKRDVHPRRRVIKRLLKYQVIRSRRSPTNEH